MIGKIYTSMFKFNNKTHKRGFKVRPVLIIKQADVGDYTVLPIASISNPHHRDAYYDIEIAKNVYSMLNLSKDVCYIRTNKIATVNYVDLDKEVSDLKSLYPELFDLAMKRFREYANSDD